MFPIDSGCKHCRSRCTRLARRTDGTGPLLAHHGAVAHAAACLRVPVGIFLRPGRLTLRFTCTGERDSRVHATEDRRSPVSGASVCWALVVAQGCAGTSRPPRPTPARRTTPPRLGSPPPRRTRPPGYRGGRDTARHAPHACSRPAVAGGAPAADHPRPGLRATRPACGGPCDARRRGLAQAQAEAPIRARHASDRRPHTRHGDATHAPGCAGPAAPARPGLGRRGACPGRGGQPSAR